MLPFLERWGMVWPFLWSMDILAIFLTAIISMAF
jgi:hypothetical protein